MITLTIHLNIKMHTIKHYKMPNQSLIKIVIPTLDKSVVEQKLQGLTQAQNALQGSSP